MRQASRQKTNETDNLKLKQRLREGLTIICIAVAIFLFIALCTYHVNDPGWSTIGFSDTISNAGGKIGAWFADLFLYIFGYLAYLLPLMVCFLAFLAWQENHSKAMLASKHMLFIRSLGVIFFMITGTALLDILLPTFHAHLPFRAGGILGNVVGQSFLKECNYSGSLLILVPAFLISITLFSGLSWVKLSQRFLNSIKGFLLNLKNKLRDKMGELKNQYRETKALKSAELYPKEESTRILTLDEILEKKPAPVRAIKKVEVIAPAVIAPAEKKRAVPVFKKNANQLLPSIELLEEKEPSKNKGYSKEFLEAKSREVEQRLKDFGIDVRVVAVHPGPVITRYEMELAPGIKVNKITSLVKDLARSLSTISVRVVEIIPGKAVVGLELPNDKREVVRLREVLESPQYEQAPSKLSLALGKDIAGHPYIVDLGKMPHLLVAGTTGAGKSVALNAMLLSLLYKATPEEVRLILVDPKMLELSIYEGIPHLLAPVVTDMKEAANALRWCVGEMDRRYHLMSSLGVRNLAGYNQKIKDAQLRGEPLVNPLIPQIEGQEIVYLEYLPSIVVLIDEFADMMMVVGKKVEELIARLAQKARAAGIHLLLATQRPSVDVITGLIKANIPTRIAFQVSSKIDSRTIIDQQGAEQLLGHGDMLYLPPGSGIPVRVHGAYVADQEVHNVVAELKTLGAPNYLPEIVEGIGESEGLGSFNDTQAEMDELYDQAVEFVTSSRKVSISSVQRRFKIGYNRAARIVEDMERAGVVSAMESNGVREVLAQGLPSD